jgi:hypothetical protein
MVQASARSGDGDSAVFCVGSLLGCSYGLGGLFGGNEHLGVVVDDRRKAPEQRCGHRPA